MRKSTQSGKPSKGGSTAKPKATRTSKATKPAQGLGYRSLKPDCFVMPSLLQPTPPIPGSLTVEALLRSIVESLCYDGSAAWRIQYGDGLIPTYHAVSWRSLANDNAASSSPKTK